MHPWSLALPCAIALVFASAAHAEPSQNDNAGTWTDGYVDDQGVRTFTDTRYDAQGRRIVLVPGETIGTFDTTPIAPASFTTWNTLYLNANRPGDATIRVWVVANNIVYGQTMGTRQNLPLPLVLAPSDVAGYSLMASLANIPSSATPIEVLVELAGPTITPSVSGIRVTWTSRSQVNTRLEAPASIPSNGTIAYRVNVGVSFVDTANLVVELPLPTPANNVASARQDQSLTFQNATEGGTLSADGTKVVWNLGVRRAGETFTLVTNFRTRMGTWNGTAYTATVTANPGNGTPAVSTPITTTVTSAPQLALERNFGGGVYRIDNQNYAFADSDVTYVFRGWNYRGYPGSGGETLFDAVVWDDVTNLIRTLNGQPVSGGPIQISHGGVYTPIAIPLSNGKTVPANSVYWRLTEPRRRPVLPVHLQAAHGQERHRRRPVCRRRGHVRLRHLPEPLRQPARPDPGPALRLLQDRCPHHARLSVRQGRAGP